MSPERLAARLDYVHSLARQIFLQSLAVPDGGLAPMRVEAILCASFDAAEAFVARVDADLARLRLAEREARGGR